MSPVRRVWALALLCLLGACGGGGGGSSVTIPTPVPTPPVSAQLPAVPLAATNSALDSAQLQAIHADFATSQYGYRGQGVVIGMLDSGLRSSHDAFNAPGKLLTGYNTFDGSSNVTDDVDHGTGTASIAAGIAAPGGNGLDAGATAGVASLASILPIKVLRAQQGADPSSVGTSANIDAGLQYARSRAFIVNLSLTYPMVSAASQVSASAFQGAVASGLLVVVAAGNNGTPNPDWPARFAKESWANGQILAVGAVDLSNPAHPVLANFGGGQSSAAAGDTASWYLVAPGVNVQKAQAGGDSAFDAGSGTSFAAPQVAGAAAVLKGRWEFLTAQHIAQILLNSATPIADPLPNNATFGHGLLNLSAALLPANPVAVPAAAGGSRGLAAFIGAAPAATGDAVARASVATIVVDAYGRDYPVDLAPGLATRRLPLAAMPAVATSSRELQPGLHMATLESADGALGLGLSGQDFTLEAGSTRPTFLLAAPGVLALSEGMRAGLSVPIDNRGLSAFALSATGTLNSSLAGLSWHAGALTVQWAGGYAREAGTALGGSFGALGPARTQTTVQSLGGALELAGWRLEAAADVAGTRGTDLQMNAQSYSLRALHQTAGDVAGLELYQPLRVSSGVLWTDLATGLDASGAPLFQRQSLGLVPSGRELQAVASWQHVLDHDSLLAVRGFAIRQPGHDQSATPEFGVMTTLSRRF